MRHCALPMILEVSSAPPIAQVSDCDTAKHGGDLGWFAADYMQPEFEEAVLALKVGELSDVVHTASGAHLILRTG